jgi:hypothetical protein
VTEYEESYGDQGYGQEEGAWEGDGGGSEGESYAQEPQEGTYEPVYEQQPVYEEPQGEEVPYATLGDIQQMLEQRELQMVDAVLAAGAQEQAAAEMAARVEEATADLNGVLATVRTELGLQAGGAEETWLMNAASELLDHDPSLGMDAIAIAAAHLAEAMGPQDPRRTVMNRVRARMGGEPVPARSAPAGPSGREAATEAAKLRAQGWGQ